MKHETNLEVKKFSLILIKIEVIIFVTYQLKLSL